jgi:hypothetical protein
LNIINAPIYTSKTQPTSNWQVCNGLCSAFSNWKTKKLRRNDNTIEHWLMLVKTAQFKNAQSIHRGFYKEKKMDDNKKKLFRH